MRNDPAPEPCLRRGARRGGGLGASRLARRTLGVFGVTLALVSGVPSSVRAEDDATIAMARERFKEGVQFFDQKQYDKARAAFLQAYALKRHPAVLLNLAQSELRSDHEAEAAKHFSQYLREHKDASDTERQAAEAGLASAKAQVAEVSVTVDEDGATIWVDGATEGQSPLPGPVFVQPGAHTLSARKESREATSQVTLTAGQASSASLRLRKPPATSAPQVVEPSARPPEATSEPRPKRPQLSEPSSEVTSEADAGVSTNGRQPFFKWAAHSPVAWVGGGITALGLAGGIGFWIASRQNYADADSIANSIRAEALKPSPPIETRGICLRPIDHFAAACRAYEESVDDGDHFKTAAWISTGVGAAAAAGTIVYYFVSPTAREEARNAHGFRLARVTPWLVPGSQGLSLGGEF